MHEPARDRAGEIFEDDLTEETLPSPVVQEEADHDEDIKKTDMDDQTGDAFMREHYGKGDDKGAKPGT